ncbi:MAG: GNAT family N-acetyltransferase [Phycisphaerae bacterium]|nr:GNAT family N-acetyltransferase [Phycisphaerae bacterium]
MNVSDVMTAARRSDRAWYEQVCESESLDFGVAYMTPRFPRFSDGNQLRDAWIADARPDEVYDRCESFFGARGLTCGVWTPASGQDIGPVSELLTARGWRRRDVLAMGLPGRDAHSAPASITDSTIRVLPARAMRRAYRSLLEASAMELEAAGRSEAVEAAVETGIERLDDSNYDATIAQVDGIAAGRIAYLEVGDIARLVDLDVAAAFRGGEVGDVLVAHFLQTARRLSPRCIVACVEAGDLAGRELLERHGFVPAGELPRFVRSGVV